MEKYASTSGQGPVWGFEQPLKSAPIYTPACPKKEEDRENGRKLGVMWSHKDWPSIGSPTPSWTNYDIFIYVIFDGWIIGMDVLLYKYKVF